MQPSIYRLYNLNFLHRENTLCCFSSIWIPLNFLMFWWLQYDGSLFRITPRWKKSFIFYVMGSATVIILHQNKT